jgi:hypothetical protein
LVDYFEADALRHYLLPNLFQAFSMLTKIKAHLFLSFTHPKRDDPVSNNVEDI